MTYEQRRKRLREIHRHMMEDLGLTWGEAVEEIARTLERSDWTVRMWMSQKANGQTIPNDALRLLELLNDDD